MGARASGDRDATSSPSWERTPRQSSSTPWEKTHGMPSFSFTTPPSFASASASVSPVACFFRNFCSSLGSLLSMRAALAAVASCVVLNRLNAFRLTICGHSAGRGLSAARRRARKRGGPVAGGRHAPASRRPPWRTPFAASPRTVPGARSGPGATRERERGGEGGRVQQPPPLIDDTTQPLARTPARGALRRGGEGAAWRRALRPGRRRRPRGRQRTSTASSLPSSCTWKSPKPVAVSNSSNMARGRTARRPSGEVACTRILFCGGSGRVRHPRATGAACGVPGTAGAR